MSDCCNDCMSLPIGPKGDKGDKGDTGTAGIAYYSFALADGEEKIYKKIFCDDSVTYVPVCDFIYPGIDSVSPITKIFVNAFRVPGEDPPDYSCQLIIKDESHLTTIAESATFDSISINYVVDMGTISNLPHDLSVFRLYVKCIINDNTQAAGISSVMVGQY